MLAIYRKLSELFLHSITISYIDNLSDHDGVVLVILVGTSETITEKFLHMITIVIDVEVDLENVTDIVKVRGNENEKNEEVSNMNTVVSVAFTA